MGDGGFTESTVEDAALAWLEAGWWQIAHGPYGHKAEPREARR